LGLSPPRAGAGRPLRPADRPSDDDDEASDWGSRGHGGGGRPAGRSNVVVVVVVVVAAADVRIAVNLRGRKIIQNVEKTYQACAVRHK